MNRSFRTRLFSGPPSGRFSGLLSGLFSGALPFVWLALVFAGLAVAALGLDYRAKALSHATLREAAESAARAALSTRLMLDEDAARAAARAVIRRQEAARDGRLLGGSIDFGRVDALTGAFLPEPGAAGAVRIVAWGPGAGRPALGPVFRSLTGEPDFGTAVERVLVADPMRCGGAAFCALGAEASPRLSAR